MDEFDIEDLADQGYSYDDIVEEMLDAGYDQDDINEAFAGTDYDWQDALIEAIENQVPEIDLEHDAAYYADLLDMDISEVYDLYFGYGNE